MVETQLAPRGIRDLRVLEAMGRIPRERFVPGALGRLPEEAYRDGAISVGRGQTLSQPYVVAMMTQALAPGPDDRVLEIGTGTGYQTAILAHLAREVWSIERDPVLAREARRRLEGMGFENVRYRTGDGTLGWSEEAPFDGILVAAGAPEVPEPLVDQLGSGGRLIVPVGSRADQELLLVTRDGDGRLQPARALLSCRFVPLVGAAGWPEPGGE